MSVPSWSPRRRPTATLLLLGTVGTAVTNQYLYKNMPYDSVKSFAPIALVGEVANVLAVHPSFPAKSVAEFVAYCKAQGPNKVSYGSPAVGGTGHLAMEYLSSLTGMQLEHVVYRGSSLVMKDLLAGHILDHHGQPAALPAAHPVGRAASARRQLLKRWFSRPMCRPSPRAAFPASMRRRGGMWRRRPARRPIS